MSKLVKMVKKGASSIAGTVKGALKGDVNDLLSAATLGGSKRLEQAGMALHKPFKAPAIPDAPGLGQSNTEEAAPNVDLAATESSRRGGGSAVGTRKLRVPLGGLR
jgi:hypothetical protein